MGKIIGIDIGDANAVAAVAEGGKPCVIPNAEDLKVTPCFGSVTDTVYLGSSARHQMRTRPEQVYRSFYSRMGRSMDTEQLTSRLLLHLKRDALSYLGEPASGAVLTVPPTFTQTQRRALVRAAKSAGLTVSGLVQDTSAFALRLVHLGLAGHTLLFDFGASHTGVSFAELGDGIAEVLAVDWDETLCGNWMDEQLALLLAERIQENNRVRISKGSSAWSQLLYWAEDVKTQLSEGTTAYACFPLLFDQGRFLPVETAVSRAEFEQRISPAVQRLEQTVQAVLSAVAPEYRSTPLKQVAVTGLGQNIPLLQGTLRKIFGNQMTISFYGQETAAEGAAILGGIRSGDFRDLLLLEVTSHTVGVRTDAGMIPLIEKNTTIPTNASQIFSTSTDGQSTVNIQIVESIPGSDDSCETVTREQITDIPPAPEGVPRIQVYLEYDRDGLLTVESSLLEPEKKAAEPPAPASAADQPLRQSRPAQQPSEEPNPTVLKMIDDILPTIDNLDQAIRNTRDPSVITGMKITVKGLLEKMQEWGVEEIPALGLPFDPHVHEALMMTSGDTDDTVAEVIRRGFRINGRILRYAQVIVTKRS